MSATPLPESASFVPVPRLPGGRPVLALLLSSLVLCQSADAEDGEGPKSIPSLQSAIEKVLKETKTPGVGIAIVSRDKVAYVYWVLVSLAVALSAVYMGYWGLIGIRLCARTAGRPINPFETCKKRIVSIVI